jgi:uncharacterized membrane protein
MGASKVLGIISLCTGWLIPLAGVVLSIIGLSIKEQKGKEQRDKTLNLIGLVMSIVAWAFWYYYVFI